MREGKADRRWEEMGKNIHKGKKRGVSRKKTADVEEVKKCSDKRTEKQTKRQEEKPRLCTEECIMKNKVLSQSQEFDDSYYLCVCIITLSKHRAPL